jgi:AbrB family looped-hinge helix DNA binding protein
VTTLKLHYDGWLALPAGLRQKLGLKSGDRLEAELVGGVIVLRPAAATREQAEPELQAVEPSAAAPIAPSAEAAMPGKRGRGRPRKIQAAEPGAAKTPDMPDEAQLPAKRRPGRPRKVRAAEEPAPAAAPASGAGETWILRRKADRPPVNAGDEAVAPPPRRPERVTFDTGYTREERNPFRRVEVRKLGPGRGHNRPRHGALG